MTVYEKFKQVQLGLKAPKGQRNDFGGFNYRSCEDILEALKPLLKETNAVLLMTDDIREIGGRYYVKATATFQDTEGEDGVSVSAYARETEERPKMDAAQITGSASSYARKYALNGLFCIDDTKDPDAMNTGQDQQKPAGRTTGRTSTQPARSVEPPKRINRQQIEHLQGEADKKGVAYLDICKRYQKRTMSEFTENDYRRALTALAKMPDVIPAAEEFLDYTQEELPWQ